MFISPKTLTIISFVVILLLFKIDTKATISGLKSSSEFLHISTSLIEHAPLILIDNQDKKNLNIEFQINSEITYFIIDQFKRPESKQQFLDAMAKTAESKKLTLQTDSLRKAYSSSTEDQKDRIAALIIDGEKKILALNEEIPGLFEKARVTENQYWQTATDDQRSKEINQVRAYKDSIQQINLTQRKQAKENTTIPDTITFYKADKIIEVAAEPAILINYKILVGTFKTKLPESIAKSIKKLEILRKVDVTKDDKGITYYTTGNLKTYQEAITLQTQVKLEGIKNPTIIAFKNNVKISLDEAKKLTNEVNVKP